MENENKKIFMAITAAMGEVKAVGKNQKNTQQNYSYRGIDDIANEMHSIFSKYKIFVTPDILDHSREERQTAKGGNLIYSILKVKYTFWTIDGSSVDCTVIGEGMDSGDKASNKALAGAYKYALTQIFCIPTAEAKDSEKDTPEPVTEPERRSTSSSFSAKATEAQIRCINTILAGNEAKRTQIKNNYKIEHLKDLSKEQASFLITSLDKDKEKLKKVVGGNERLEDYY